MHYVDILVLILSISYNGSGKGSWVGNVETAREPLYMIFTKEWRIQIFYCYECNSLKESVDVLINSHCIFFLIVDIFFYLGTYKLIHQVMQTAGINGQQVVLLLEDYQFVEGTFLELVNSLLSAGEVPGLYTTEELDPLLSPLRDEASEVGFRGTLLQYYAQSMLLVYIFLDFFF